jgi:FixJ family two-component response regulator
MMLSDKLQPANFPPVGTLVSVVDDDASFLRSLGRLLRSAGYTVQTFSSARQFLSSVKTCLPQCLVLDVHMPEMTGLQLQENLESQGLCVPVIFVTAYDTPQTREHARRAGSFGLLLKPFDKDALLRAIQEAVQCQTTTDQGDDE